MLCVLFLGDDDGGTANATQGDGSNDHPPIGTMFGIHADGFVSRLRHSFSDFITADQTGLGGVGGRFCAGGMCLVIGLFIADNAGMPMVFSVIVPGFAVDMTDFPDVAANATVGVTSILKVMHGKTVGIFASGTGKPVVGFIRCPGVGIAVFVVPCGSDDISTDGAGLGGLFGSLGTGCVGCGILFVTTDAALVPMVILVVAPCAVILMGDLAGLTTAVAVGVAVVIIGMGGGFCNYLGFRGTAGGTGVGFFAFCFAGGLFAYGTLVPGVSSGFLCTADGAGMLMGSIVGLFPGAVGVRIALGNGFRFGMATGSTGESFFTFSLTIGLLGHFSAVQSVGNSFFFATEGTGVLMAVVIDFAPCTVGVAVRLGHGFRLSMAAGGASEGFLTGFLTVGGLCYFAVVPSMGNGFFFTAGGASAFVILAVRICPCTKTMIFCFCYCFGFGSGAASTGNGLFTGILTGRLLGNGSLIPCVICFFNGATIGTGALVFAVIDFRPCAEAVIALDIDGQRIDRSGDGTVIVTGIHIGRDGGVANGRTALNTEGKGEDLAGNGGTFCKGKSAGTAGEAGQSRAAEGTFTADKLKDTAVVNQHKGRRPAVLYLGNTDGEINGVATVCTGLGSTDGHGSRTGGKDGTNHGGE